MHYFLDSGQSLGAQASNGIALGDLDRDGDLDAFVANGAGLVTDEPDEIWLNDGHGIFTLGQKLGTTTSLAVALGDVDKDGDLDALVGTSGYSDGALVWINNGAGHFTDSAQRLGSQDAAAVALGDMDGDGDLDAVILDRWEHGNRLWLNNGAGVFHDSGQVLGQSESWDLALGDIDGDKDIDIFIANSDGLQSIGRNTVWFNDGKGHFTKSPQVFERVYSTSVELGDLDRDGDLDALVINHPVAPASTSQVLLNDGHGQFTDSGQTLGVGYNNAAALLDVDRDGALDAVAANTSSTGFAPTQLWINDGRGGFRVGQALSDYNQDIAVGDLNGDGRPDLFFANMRGCDFSCLGFPNDVWFNNVHLLYLPKSMR
jgi:FG-GAP-like repeat